jgi:hypothetical protein
MAAAVAWAPEDPLARFGLSAGGPGINAQTELTALATPSAEAARAAGLVSAENPLLWFGVLAGVTFGLMAFSTSVRVGNSSASVNLGKP